MTAPKTTVRRVRADERAAWEPLWKGYQTAHKDFGMKDMAVKSRA